MHRLTFVHQPLGESGIHMLEWLFNSKAVPARGGIFTVDSALPNMDKPFNAFFGPSQRMIVDLNDLDHSLAINSTGQSGQLFHAHRDDQVDMWQEVQYHQMLFSQRTIDESAKAVLILTH